ncbi:hypothetical protein O3G_MSEX012775 [Manduca sexta]|uniref:Uncharacterized protein n=1 Tax=Manduca sexta TaxID=7130 RepID=A0A921ZP54_MANSE|nr:hypothetical protein O3G_MSEX012775 [Manduca sexta]
MGKFWRAKSKMLLVAAVFISLSELASTIEGTKCYWCGPLADQVHRSRRSQPCNASTYEETTCDPGYDYCAVIATSPPLTESRVCVKVYQDECYSVYCNSSRHWRVVCPCRGELCNGPATQRETEAFTTLFQKAKRSIFGTKKLREKRALVASANFISARRPRVENVSEPTMSNIVNQATDADKMNSEENNKMEENVVHSTVSDEMTKMPEGNDITNWISVETKDIEQNDVATTIEEMDTKTMSTTNNEAMQKDESIVVQNIKPSKDTLTAEALQQNVNPDKQATEMMTTLQATVSTTPSTTRNGMFTEEPHKNNTATAITHNHMLTSMIGMILQRYL